MKKIENAPKLKEMLEKLLCEYVHDNIGGIIFKYSLYKKVC